LRTGFK
jgi:amino acid permease